MNQYVFALMVLKLSASCQAYHRHLCHESKVSWCLNPIIDRRLSGERYGSPLKIYIDVYLQR